MYKPCRTYLKFTNELNEVRIWQMRFMRAGLLCTINSNRNQVSCLGLKWNGLLTGSCLGHGVTKPLIFIFMYNKSCAKVTDSCLFHPQQRNPSPSLSDERECSLSDIVLQNELKVSTPTWNTGVWYSFWASSVGAVIYEHCLLKGQGREDFLFLKELFYTHQGCISFFLQWDFIYHDHSLVSCNYSQFDFKSRNCDNLYLRLYLAVASFLLFWPYISQWDFISCKFSCLSYNSYIMSCNCDVYYTMWLSIMALILIIKSSFS